MSDITELRDDLVTLEYELETFIDYDRAKNATYSNYDDCRGIRGEFSILERKIIQDYLKKRIAWFEAEIKIKGEQEAA
jgi:hypothetical protein